MTLSWNDRYSLRREPNRTLRAMTPSDVPGTVLLTAQIGWNQGAADWNRQLDWSPEGCFLIEEPGQGIVGAVTTTSYGTDLGWIGMLMIAPDRQRRGLGGQLMRAAMDHLIARGTDRIMLDATEAGRVLYRRMGFRDVCKIERWEGRASTYLGPRARRMKDHDLAAVLETDAKLFGISREHILTRLYEEFPDLAWVDYEKDRLEGYLFGRRLQNRIHLGPWMSWSSTSGKRLLLVALEQLQGQNITLDIPDHNGRSLILASDHNFKRTRHATRMIYGEAMPLRGELLTELAVTSLATG